MSDTYKTTYDGETSTKVRSYTYDKSNRLKAETANGYTLEYAYNKDGTLCSETGGGVVKAYSYENGRVTGYIKSGDIARTEFEYDNYGNCIQYCKTPFSSTEIEWERGNLLKKIRNTEYEYNSSGLRFRKKTGSETTDYYYDGTKLLGENRNGEKEIRYIYDAEGISGFEIASEANPYMFVKDARNNVVAILDNGGEVAAYEYDAWGSCKVVKDTNGIGTLNPVRWKSQYYDSDSGFYYINNRFYSATTKQFLDGGSPETALANATTIYGLNPHNSTLTNPLSEVYNEYTIETATELAFDPPELTKWQSYWRSGWGKGLATALFVMATIATIAASIAFPIFAPEIWAGYAFAFGAVVVSLGIGALLAGYQSSQQGYGFWNGFVNYIRNNWAQEVAITSAIYIVNLGINTLRYSVANASVVSPETAIKKYPPNNGAVVGTEKIIELQPGKYSRYGEITPTSKYITNFGADPASLSLPPWNDGVFTEITVVKPIPNVMQSTVAPWLPWEGIGGGIQYLLPDTLLNLRDMGYVIF